MNGNKRSRIRSFSLAAFYEKQMRFTLFFIYLNFVDFKQVRETFQLDLFKPHGLQNPNYERLNIFQMKNPWTEEELDENFTLLLPERTFVNKKIVTRSTNCGRAINQ